MSIRFLAVSVLVPLLGSLFLPAPAVAQTTRPGYGFDEVPIAPAGAFVGGFEVLPSGNYAVFDGIAVVEVAASDGAFVRTLHTPASPVFGAFLTLSPDGSKLYFGESSDGKVYEIDLATLAALWVIDTVFPYDLAFDPKGRAFLTYSFGFNQGSFVALCDFTTGALDDVIATKSPSGPLAFDAAGDLYTATPDASSFPPPLDATEILRFAQADLESAIGPAVLDESHGALLGVVDGATGIALDEAEDVLVTDANYGKIVDLDALTQAETVVAQAGPFEAFLYLRHARGTRGAFEPWQPGEAGTLLAVRSDFFSFNQLTRVRPARPELSTTPPSPIPPGTFDFHVTGAVENGFGLMLITGSAAGSELALKNRTWPAPLFIGLDFAGGLTVVPIATDGTGEYHEPVDNTGFGGVTVAFQLVVGESATGPLYGTSAAMEIVLQ